MKKTNTRWISIVLVLALVISFIPVFKNKAQAWTLNQQNIADRADFFFNTTWVCQKTVYGWRDQFTYYEGETYHLPYGQPVNSGKFIGYGVDLEDFLIAAADGNSVYYNVQSEYNGWTSVYYATDCAAFVAMCWGTVRQDCSTLPYYSTYKGAPNENNIRNILQLGDALDSTSVGHVVLVTDMVYDENGELIQIEITEQTPPQLKRTYFTPSELADKYGAEFGIYRYEGSVPAVPEWGYTAECTNYASYCEVEIMQDTPVMSLPCLDSTDEESTEIGTALAGTTCITTRMYENTTGELWYRIVTDGDQDGYIAAKDTLYRKHLLDDIALTDASYPNAHIRGKTFSLVGNLYAKYNQLVTASAYIYKGFGSDTSPVTGDSDYVTSNAYTLKNSNIDYNSSFGSLTLGNHTIAIGATYKCHYATGADTYEVITGSIDLAEEYFMVVSSSTNQNSCNHNYTETVMSVGTCTEPGLTIFACSLCGKVYKQTDTASGHRYSDWSITEATCTQEGTKHRSCNICGSEDTQVIPANGHSYLENQIEGSCQDYPRTVYTCVNCSDSYTVYPEQIMSDWQDTMPEDIDESMIETKTQYRYSEMEQITSDQEYLDGYIPMGSLWETAEVKTTDYVKTWPAGFDTTHSLYNQYKQEPLTTFETDSQKLTIDTDKCTGYLYYHWCYRNSYYSRESKSGQYNIFHAYYSTTAPDTYRVDTSDWSYCTAHETCSNTDWYFVAEVNTQTATLYQKIYLHGRWQDYSQWSDAPVEASETRTVETRTVYRYPDITTTGHQYEASVTDPTCTQPGSVTYNCSVCGDSYTETIAAPGHQYEAEIVPGTCTEAGSVTYSCSVCGDSYTETSDAPGHRYKTVTVPATCTENGSITYTCSVCNDSYSEVLNTIEHSFIDGVCESCGAAEQIVVPTITPKYPSLSFEDEVLINVYFSGTDLDLVSTQDMGLLTWSVPGNNCTIENAEYVISGADYDEETGLYCVHSQGIAAKNLGDNVYFKIFVRLNDGSYIYSSLKNYSPATYAKTVLEGNFGTPLKSLVVAMLHYGAQAQTYFDYKPYQLMDATLTQEQTALVDVYNPGMVADVAAINAAKHGVFASTGSGFARRYPTISFESAFSINYYFTPNQTPEKNLKLYVWNQSDYANAEVLTTENATEVLTMTGETEYWAAVTGIAAKDIEGTIYVSAVYQDTNGQTHCSGILNYSLGAYCKIQAAGTDPIAPFAAATAVYGYYAKIYFTK